MNGKHRKKFFGVRVVDFYEWLGIFHEINAVLRDLMPLAVLHN